MKKPKPEDFGLSTEKIKEIEVEEKKFDRISEYTYWILVFILALNWSVRMDESGEITWGAFFLTLFLMIPTAMILGAVGFPMSKILEKIIHFFKPEFKRLKNFKDRLEAYESWFVKTQLDFWRSLSGRQFEIELARLLQKHGHEVKVVGGAGDKGIDIILDGNTAVQCKAYKAKVGPAAIRDLIGSMKNANYKSGILASINGFSTGVYEYNKKNNIQLLDASNYIQLQKELSDG